jgi:hypothetical protein
MNAAELIFLVLAIGVPTVIAYAVIRAAVRAGIKDARDDETRDP